MVEFSIPSYLAMDFCFRMYQGVKGYMSCTEPEPGMLASILVWMNVWMPEKRCPSLGDIAWKGLQQSMVRIAIATIILLCMRYRGKITGGKLMLAVNCVYLSVYIVFHMLVSSLCSGLYTMRACVRNVTGSLMAYVRAACAQVVITVPRLWCIGRQTSQTFKYYMCRDAFTQSGEIIILGVSESRVSILRKNKSSGKFECVFRSHISR